MEQIDIKWFQEYLVEADEKSIEIHEYLFMKWFDLSEHFMSVFRRCKNYDKLWFIKTDITNNTTLHKIIEEGIDYDLQVFQYHLEQSKNNRYIQERLEAWINGII